MIVFPTPGKHPNASAKIQQIFDIYKLQGKKNDISSKKNLQLSFFFCIFVARFG